MSELKADSTEADFDALEALQADASELEQIEDLLDRFNVFETIGFDRDELMHSNFLAFLLDPNRNDGLRDLFFKEVLRETLATAHKTLTSLQKDLDSVDLDKTLVRREHRDIDILLTNETHKLAVIIENKIWSDEQAGQLDKYDRIVRYNHPDWDLLKIYLTPFAAAPTHQDYVAISYGAVCGILDRILEERGSTVDSDVRMSIEHYVGMVRRRILGDPEVVRRCQQIYLRHKRAFDLIYKHRPDFRLQSRLIVEELIREHSNLEQEDSSIDTIRFGVTDWDEIPALRTAEGWTTSRRILMFVVYNNPDSLDLHLYMGPGPKSIRQQIVEMACDYPEFLLMPSSVKPKWISIYSRPLLKQEAYKDLEGKAREQELRRQWREFLDKDLPRLEVALKGEKWIWDPVEADG